MLKEATIHFFRIDDSQFSNICTLSLCDNIIYRNKLCKHRKKVMSSQTCISINSCTELSKTKFFPVSINLSKYSLEPKNFLRGTPPPKSPSGGLRPPAPLTLATLPFPLIMIPVGSYDIHPGHNKMACD